MGDRPDGEPVADDAESSAPSGRGAMNSFAVLIPVKAFDRAKGRLADRLSPNERATLARQMATQLVRSQGDTHVAIACDDESVSDWADELAAEVVWCAGTDLNGAVAQAIAALAASGVVEVAISHSDLPLAGSLKWLSGWPGITIVPDRHRTGTNVMVVPTNIDFEFAYGPNSYRAHAAEAVRHQVGLRIVHNAALGWDIDEPADLDLPNGESIDQRLKGHP